nr:ephrin-A4 isoform X3 [Desmodus rotundus]
MERGLLTFEPCGCGRFLNLSEPVSLSPHLLLALRLSRVVSLKTSGLAEMFPLQRAGESTPLPCACRLLRGDAVVELGLNDYLDIFCPHYEGPGPPEGPETFALYMVDWSGYEACQAQGAGAFKRWECSLPFAPFGPVKFSEKIQRFTPFSLGFEFLPGETYYYISVPTPGSPGQCLRLQVSVCCKESRTRALPRHPGGGAPAT